jgi:signal transduction histidine kinase
VTTFLWSFVGWTAYALVATNLLQVVRPRLGAPSVPFWGLFYFVAVSAWLWALLTPPIVSFARRFAIRSWRDLRWLPLHFVVVIVAHVVHESAVWYLHPLVGRQGPRGEFPDVLFGYLFLNLFVVAALIAMVHAFDGQRRSMRLEHALLESEMRLLRMQLQPHFLFNTLNGIAELVHRDPGRAERAVIRLADLLRWSLQSGSLREVALRDELGALETYLDIQRLRLGDGVRFEIAADDEVLGLAVPSLLLQPLVENAIRHGVRGAERATVRVSAERREGKLVLAVRDDGRGFAGGWTEGTGLGTTRARLRGLYGGAHELRIEDGAGRGGCVVIALPAREPAAPGSEA